MTKRVANGGNNGISHKLKTAADLRRFLQRVTNQYMKGDITAEKFRNIMYGAPNILESIKASTIEEQLSLLEADNEAQEAAEGNLKLVEGGKS